MAVSPEDDSFDPFLTDGFVPQITDATADFCDQWFAYVDREAVKRSLGGMRPVNINFSTERPFAHFIHRVVADQTALDNRHRQHALITRALVHNEIDEYYRRFPPHLQDDPSQYRARVAYQDQSIEVTSQYAAVHPEIMVVCGLRLAFKEHRLVAATRSTLGVLSAYGRALLTMYPTDPAADTVS